MATVIAVSSFVARGTVGLRAIMPALDRMGHEAIALPTILLSSHLGHAQASGSAVAPQTLAAMIDALEANGWLAGAEAVLTGYLPSPDHVHVVQRLFARVRAARPQALVVCDPVLGDADGGLYVPRAVADEVAARLVPLATHLKLNAFELAFLSGRPVESPADAVAAAKALGPPVVLATSVPVAADRLANVIVTADHAAQCTVAREAHVPHGTGDLVAAIFTAHTLDGEDPATSAGFATGAVAAAIAVSRGADELNLSGPSGWHEAPPLAMSEIDLG
ncbi:MAG: PfkB family carbohydrate kinase [Hyphomicrobium sp.]|uniref:PfkB family carbohydrate kinase n=1 Tax=Hyphomicrobium sp. TaxID=82 RepID=UPI003D0D4594